MKRIFMLLVVTGFSAYLVNSVSAFDLSPKGTRMDQDAVKAWAPSWLDGILSKITNLGLLKFKHPVHEEITHRIYGCKKEGVEICGDPDAQFATPYIIAGTRWNDDPPFQLEPDQAKSTSCKTTYPDGRAITIRFITQPMCWAQLFLLAEKEIKADDKKPFSAATQDALPLRSHFGDLQFVHSMASSDGEQPSETREKILNWAKFTWGVVRGDYKLETWLRDINEPTVQKYFGHGGWRVQELFTLGDPTLRPELSDVAFGSLLHMVEDSFAAGHVDRMDPVGGAVCTGSSHLIPGPIREFHSYSHQSSSKHANADTRQAFDNNRMTPDVVDVGQILVKMRKDNVEWAEVEAYLMCVYNLAPDVRLASAGRF